MPKPRDLRLLLYFVEIARAGSIRAAAAKLGLSPAVVSEALSELEALVGVTLIRRTTRSMVLTPDGEDMLEHAALVVSAGDKAMAVARPSSSALSGPVRITAPTEVAVGWFPPLLRAFEASHPGVRVEVDAEDAMVALASSDLDLAIRTRFAERPKTGKDLCACLALELVCAPRQMGAADEPLEARLERMGIIGTASRPRRGGRTLVVRDDQDGSVRELTVPVRFSVNNQLVAHRFALEGFGSALLFRDGVAADLKAGRLVQAAPGYSFGFVTCQVVPRDKYPTRQAQALMAYLLEHAPAQMKTGAPH